MDKPWCVFNNVAQICDSIYTLSYHFEETIDKHWGKIRKRASSSWYQVSVTFRDWWENEHLQIIHLKVRVHILGFEFTHLQH